MGVMTAAGKMLMTATGEPLTVACGDRVELVGELTGVVHCWTKLGVMVTLDTDTPRPILGNQYHNLLVAALDVGDRDIVRKL